MRLPFLLLTVVALLLGLGVGELLSRSAAVRDIAGRVAGRGRLRAIVNEKGIYETDLGEGRASGEELVIAKNLERLAVTEVVERAAIDREIALLAAQCGDLKTFEKALENDGLSRSALHENVTSHLRVLAWLEKQIRLALAVTEPECRRFYNAHPGLFTQPVRFRVSHILLAAHAESAPEIVEEKEAGVAALSARLKKGETLAQLAAETSEDEASKTRGGDLGFFSDARMPSDFMTEIKKLRPGEVSKPFRTHLGFHIAQLTEVKDGRLLTFEEARPEISMALANERRADLAGHIARQLSEVN